MFEDAEIIHSGTRAQAIAEQLLRDVSELARERGFAAPVAITANAWRQAVAWPQEGKYGQSENARISDVLTAALHAFAYALVMCPEEGDLGTDRLPFTVHREAPDSADPTPSPVALLLHLGFGDEGEPVFTIMTPHDN
ncbi:DUF6573 family protein [Nocardia yamanashiensis]|uniref:DUF6573 family protein n=1 Tax=Nocardia yamanashiensis TaxID=209247 RepID=UPI00082B271D|nr:DUF6573 family protein [Nocardia yamanashiensis]